MCAALVVYTARVLQPQTKKWFKSHMNSTKAYCDGKGDVADRCRAIMCYATSSLLDGQFSNHFAQTSECPSKPSANSLKISKGDLSKMPELAWLKPINPIGVLVMMKDQSSKAQTLCRKTLHTSDDRCKDMVHCLTLGALTSAWPDLFKLKNCEVKDFEMIDPHAPKLKKIAPSDYEDYSRLQHIALNKEGLIDPADVPFKPKDVDRSVEDWESSSSSSDSK